MDLLDPLASSCLFLPSGWWTYKFCYLKEITQFHRESVAVQPVHIAPPPPVKTGAKTAEEAAANIAAAEAAQKVHAAAVAAAAVAAAASSKMAITAEFILGRIPASVSDEELEHQTKLVRGESWEESYVSQQYTDGTVCDLNHRPRRTESRIYCNPDESTLGVIKSVQESATCEYIVVIQSPLLCAHPVFRPAVPSLHEISCVPAEPDTLPVTNLLDWMKEPSSSSAAAATVLSP
jgi:protein OS-9